MGIISNGRMMSKSNLISKLLLIPIVLSIILSTLYTIQQTGFHGIGKHRIGAIAAFDCLQRNGSTKSFNIVEKGQRRKLWLCNLDNDWFSIVTTEEIMKDKQGNPLYKSVTEFSIDTEEYPTIDDYIDHIRIDKYGIETNDFLPAGELNTEIIFP